MSLTKADIQAAINNPALQQLAKGKPSFGGNYPKNGKYRFEIQVAKHKSGERGLSAISELKVVTSEKTHDNEPNKPGEIVSYVEKLNDAQKGGGGRFKTMLLAATGQSVADINSTTVEYDDIDQKTRQVVTVKETFTGDAAQALWFKKMLDQDMQPVAFLLVDAVVFPKTLPKKTLDDGTVLPGKTIEGYRWSTVNPSDEEFAAIEAKRKAANLPPLAEVLK